MYEDGRLSSVGESAKSVSVDAKVGEVCGRECVVTV